MTRHSPTAGIRAWAQGGFTLLELLLAITLLGLLALLLAGVVRLGARVWDRGAAEAERVSQIEVVQSVLRRQLGAAHPLRLATVRGERRRYAFEGDEGRLRYAVLAPPQFGVGGYYIVTLETVLRAEREDLVLTARLYHPEMPPDLDSGDARETTLLEDVAEVEFAYFGSERRGEPEDWRRLWEESPRLPALVRVRVRFAPGDPRRWPELVVAPQVQR